MEKNSLTVGELHTDTVVLLKNNTGETIRVANVTPQTVDIVANAWRYASIKDAGNAGLITTPTGLSHNNVQPVKACYVWKRTA